MTARPIIAQGGALPVFRGRSAQLFRCAACGHILVEGYEPRSLIAIDIECFSCKSITRTEEWPKGEPLPKMLVTLGNAGRFLLKGTVDLREHPALSCDQEIQRASADTAPRPKVNNDWELSPDSLKVLETQLEILTDGVFSKTAARANRARDLGNTKLAPARFSVAWALSQLHQSLLKGIIDLNGLDGIAIAYVQTLRDALHRWRDNPRFHVIAQTLCNDFHHGMTAFTVASYLSDVGNRVGIADTRAHAHTGKSPDLFVNVGRNHSLSIEVKCPQAFFWPSPVPTKEDIQRRLEKEIKDARDQIATGKAGGIVVIGAGHFSPQFAANLEECIKQVTQNKKISTKVAAISAVCFFGPTIQGMSAAGPKLTTGGDVYIACNPRFPEPNPVLTERPASTAG